MSGGLPGSVLLDSASSSLAPWAYRGVSCELLIWGLRECPPWRAPWLAPRLTLPQRPVHTPRSKNSKEYRGRLSLLFLNNVLRSCIPRRFVCRERYGYESVFERWVELRVWPIWPGLPDVVQNDLYVNAQAPGLGEHLVCRY